jgi:hypothetical protein
MFSLSFVDGTCYIYVILYLFTYTGVKHDFNIIYMMFVEQKQLIFPDYMGSLRLFCVIHVAQS